MDNGTIESCNNLGNVTANKQLVGGILGLMNAGTIRNCSNRGYILSKSEGIIGISGGIVGGNMKGIIEKVYNEGKVEAVHYGNDGVGGIVGMNRDVSTISYSYNKGEIIGEGIIGGIIGYKSKGTVEKCYYFSNTLTKGIGNQDTDTAGETDKVEDNINSFEEFLTWIESK